MCVQVCVDRKNKEIYRLIVKNRCVQEYTYVHIYQAYIYIYIYSCVNVYGYGYKQGYSLMS